MKALALFGFAVLILIFGSAAMFFWAFSGGSEAPLTADAILVFDSPKAVTDHYGYVNKTYTAALPPFAEEAHPQTGIPTRTDGFDHYLRIRFSAVRPVSQIRAEAMAELNRIRAQKRKKTWNSGALKKAQLYTISADVDLSGTKHGTASPDVTLFQRQSDDMIAGMKAAFEFRGGIGTLAVDPGDPHVLTVTIMRNTDALMFNTPGATPATFTMKFSSDWKTADISMLDASGGSMTVTATTQDATTPQGPYLLKMATTALVASTSPAEYMFAGISSKGFINPSIPVYFQKDGDFAGKAYMLGKTYKFHAASQNGALKLFLDDAAVLSIDPQKPTTSLIRYSSESGSSIFISYTATLDKPDLHGKDQQLAANFASLGSVPETVISAPNVWGTYFDLSQRQYTAKDIVADPALRQVFGHSQAISGAGAMALEVAAAHQTRLATRALTTRVAQAPAGTPATVPDPKRPKTDAEIEKEMQQAYKKRRY
jgi:hypothetical protein